MRDDALIHPVQRRRLAVIAPRFGGLTVQGEGSKLRGARQCGGFLEILAI
jgi:hypothetical protein